MICFAMAHSGRYNDARYRGVAQLVARDIWDVEVACSNHVAPIRKPDRVICPVFGFYTLAVEVVFVIRFSAST